MRESAAAAAPPQASSQTTALGLLSGALRRLSWRVAGITFAIACAFQAWQVAEGQLTFLGDSLDAQAHLSFAILCLLMAVCGAFATLVADEAVDRGARPLVAYAWAVVAGAATAALAQMPVHQLLQIQIDAQDRPTDHFWQPVSVFLEHQLWLAICVAVYASRRTALQAAARMNAAQVERARTQRRTLESRLQALQARIEPQFLSDTLRDVKQLHASDPQRGARLLDDLIVYLRAALPQLRDSTSTVEQELQLATAYLSIGERRGGAATPVIAADPAALSVRIPPMLLLPLIQRLAAAPDGVPAPSPASRVQGSLHIRVTAQVDAVRIEASRVGVGAIEETGVLEDVRVRLQALYGDCGGIHLDRANGDVCITLQIPREAGEAA